MVRPRRLDCSPGGEHSARIWQAGETYGKEGNAVSEVMFHAIVALEAEVIALRAAAGQPK